MYAYREKLLVAAVWVCYHQTVNCLSQIHLHAHRRMHTFHLSCPKYIVQVEGKKTEAAAAAATTEYIFKAKMSVRLTK